MLLVEVKIIKHIAMEGYSNTLITWVNQYTNDLYRWAYNKTRHHETSEDLVQEVFLAAANSIGKFENRSNPKTWLFSILNNKISDHFRKNFEQQKQTVSIDMGLFFNQHGEWKPEALPKKWHNDDDNLADNAEFRAILDMCLKKLPTNWFAAVQYKYIDDRNSNDICEQLDISPANYWQLIHRAKLNLRQCVEKNWLKN